MKAIISPSKVSGSINAPASKSSMQRACAAALLCPGETILHHPGHANDDLAAIKMISDLGARVLKLPNGSLQVQSNGVQPLTPQVNCGESGLGIRMFAPIIALSNKKISILGEGSLLKRPMNFFDEIFPSLGITIQSNQGYLPVQVQGPLIPSNITIDGSLSSQFLTGLLMAFSAADARDVTITVNDLKSIPYIDLTLDVMKKFGMKMPQNDAYRHFYFPNENAEHQTARSYTVEGDWSGAAFLLVAGALSGNISVEGLDMLSSQADKAVLKALEDSGTGLRYHEGTIIIEKAAQKQFYFDAEHCPDLFPPLVALAAGLPGTSRIRGVHRLTHKESDRGASLQQEFGKMGINIAFENDDMLVEGGRALQSAEVHSHHDHRIAMSCAVAGMFTSSGIVIHDAEAVNKSYPDFYRDMQKLGMAVELSEA